MWTDLLFKLWEYAGFVMGAGLLLIALGVWAILARRADVTMGPVPAKLASPPAPSFPRPGVTPGIPGIARFSEAVDEAAAETQLLTDELRHRVAQQMRADPPPDDDDYVVDEIILVPALREVAGPTPAELDALAARLRAATLGPVAGPVCSACGGRFGACSCVGKAVDDDPLTSTTIRIDTTIDLPVLAAAQRGDTVELGSKVAKILEGQR